MTITSPCEYNENIDTGGENETVLDNIGLGDKTKLSESGDYSGLDSQNNSAKLGRIENSSAFEGRSKVGEVGRLQQEKPNTPHTKRIHRSA